MITLVLGGTRSGKSAIAERLFGPEPVTYVATGTFGTTPEWQRRVRVHQDRRPSTWKTIEVSQGANLGNVIASVEGPILVDSLGAWVAGFDATLDIYDLLSALTARLSRTVLVSEEVGWSVHPESKAGRHFQDELGRLNTAVGEIADRVLLVIVGRVIELADLGEVR